jgi:hypothetical protein
MGGERMQVRVRVAAELQKIIVERLTQGVTAFDPIPLRLLYFGVLLN